MLSNDNNVITKLQVSQIRDVNHIYLHVPFCKSFCTYCDFPKKMHEEKLVDFFLERVAKELKTFKNVLTNVETIYIGGGTPNSLNIDNMRKLLSTIKKFVSLSKVKEFTIECNPDCWNIEHLKLFKIYKINRISLGIQTTNNEINFSCNRMQTVKMVEESIKDIKENTSFSISFDFILNLFNQKKIDINNDLSFIEKYNPDHISWYSLMLKKGTPLFKREKVLSDNDYLFSKIVENKLSKLGYKKYEVSSYSKKVMNESIHNKAYWLSKNYLGVGWGSVSLLKESNENVIRSIKGDFKTTKEEIEVLSKEKYMFQVLMMGLRLVSGINIKSEPYKSAYELYFNKIQEQIKQGKIVLSKDHLYVKKEHQDFLNDILVDIM